MSSGKASLGSNLGKGIQSVVTAQSSPRLFQKPVKALQKFILAVFCLLWIHQNNFEDGTREGDNVQIWGKATESSFRHTNSQVSMQEIGFNGFL